MPFKPAIAILQAGGLIKVPVSGGGGNATVPDDAIILPPQANVDALNGILILADNNTGICTITIPGDNITTMLRSLFDYKDNGDGTLIVGQIVCFISWAVDFNAQLCVLDLSGKQLNSPSVDGLLGGLLNAVLTGGFTTSTALTINISGGTNAIPTITQEEQIALDFSGLWDGAGWQATGQTAVSVAQNVLANLADSTFVAGVLTLGTLDLPTATQIAAKAASLLPIGDTYGISVITLEGTGSATLVVHGIKPSYFPYSITNPATEPQAGMINADQQALLNAGATVTTN